MQDIINNLPKLAKDKYIENKKFFVKLKKKPPKQLDYLMQELHEDEFSRTDCLECANCCKTTSPIFTDKDINRITKYFKMKVYDFTTQFLEIDEDNFFVLKQVPCTFLNEDNSCSIYDVRPKACREYPHTDRKKIQQISNLTLKNITICPAVFNIVEEMKKRIQTSKREI
jgi:uncharacterized protein